MVGFEFGRDVLRIFGDKAFFLCNTTWQWTHSSPRLAMGEAGPEKVLKLKISFVEGTLFGR